MNSTTRLLALITRRRSTLLTAAGLLSRVPSADGTERPSNPVRTHVSVGVRFIASPHHVRQLSRPTAGPSGSG
eukprot:2756325-Prymnesium_polylepis.1